MKAISTCALVTVSAIAVSAQAATIKYSLSSTVLDGGAGENTYLVATAGGTTSPSLTYNAGTPSLTLGLPAHSSGTQYGDIVGKFGSTTLGVGDTISISYSFTSALQPSAVPYSQFRVGLFNSGGTALSTNSTAGGDASLSADTGYAAYYVVANGATGSLRQRTSTDTNILGSNAFPNSNPATIFGGNTPPALTNLSTNATAHTGTFTLTGLAGGGVKVTTKIDGNEFSVDDIGGTGGVVSTFDEFAIFGLTNVTSGTPSLVFTDLTVTTSVPEPTTVSCALMGLAGLLRRRRRGAAKR